MLLWYPHLRRSQASPGAPADAGDVRWMVEPAGAPGPRGGRGRAGLRRPRRLPSRDSEMQIPVALWRGSENPRGC